MLSGRKKKQDGTHKGLWKKLNEEKNNMSEIDLKKEVIMMKKKPVNHISRKKLVWYYENCLDCLGCANYWDCKERK